MAAIKLSIGNQIFSYKDPDTLQRDLDNLHIATGKVRERLARDEKRAAVMAAGVVELRRQVAAEEARKAARKAAKGR